MLERLEQPGKKLLATGNGRCNLTNMQAPHSRAVLDFFASLGLMTRQEDLGRVYPYSLRAATVQNLLLDACRTLGVRLVTGCRVEKIIPGFTVQTDKGAFAGDKVVVACGGQAQPALGSDGGTCANTFRPVTCDIFGCSSCCSTWLVERERWLHGLSTKPAIALGLAPPPLPPKPPLNRK